MATATVAGSPYNIVPSAATGGTFSPGNYSITYTTRHADGDCGASYGDGQQPEQELWTGADTGHHRVYDQRSGQRRYRDLA